MLPNAHPLKPQYQDGGERTPQCLAPGEVAPGAVRLQLEKILASGRFSRSPQLSRFLTYVVEDALTFGGRGLKEYEIARQVYNKNEDFDVRLDPIVRVEARRLRSRLIEYYSQEGHEDPVLIELGKRGYRPRFAIRPAGSTMASPLPESKAPEQHTSIAVIPFIDRSESGDQQYFCDGLTEELINALTRTPGLLVASRSSSFQFSGNGQDVRKVGADLDVAVILEGSVRRQGNRLRVTSQLTSANTGFHVWSETYDIELDDLFQVQEQLSHAIVETIHKQKGAPTMPLLQRKQTDRPEAYREFLRGLHLQRSPIRHDLEESEKYLAAAVEADPNYVGAIAALARTRVNLVWYEIRPPHEGWPLVDSSANRALELDPSCAIARAALGSARAAGDWNWPAADQVFAGALEHGANDAFVKQSWAVHYLSPLRKLDEAVAAVTEAIELAPNALEAWNDLAWIRYYRSEYADALEQFRSVLADKPDHLHALHGLARCYLAMQEPQKALQTLSIAREIDASPQVLSATAACYGAMNEKEEAEKVARNLEAMERKQYVSPICKAHTAIALHRFDEALGYLQTALEQRCPRLVELDIDPFYRPLRSKELLEALRIAVCLRPPEN
jgi:serine/threonine-protein kinase